MVEPEGRFLRGEGRTSKGQAERIWSGSQTIFYFLLLPLSFLPILFPVWNYSVHIMISSILAVIFIFVMHKNFGLFKSLFIVGIVWGVDVFFVQLPLEFISSTEIGRAFIMVRLFAIWPVFAAIIYLIDIASAEESPWWSKFVAMAIIAAAFLIIIPTIGLDSYKETVQSHQEYQIAKEKAKELAEVGLVKLNETKSYWSRFAEAVPYLFRGDMEGYRKTLNPPQNLTQAIERAGAVDPTIKEFTKVDFIQGEEFTREIYDLRYPIPVQLKIESPRSTIDLELSCVFSQGNKNISGIASPNQLTVLEGSKEEKVVTCFPESNLAKGSWTITMGAKVSNLITTSTLRRLFVGEKTQEEEDELKREYFPSSEDYKSQAPKEFVRINFLVGEPPTNPIIDQDDAPLLTAMIENIGTGEIESLEKAGVFLPPGLYPVSDPARCSLLPYVEQDADGVSFIKVDFDVSKVKGKKQIPFGICALEVEPRLKYPEEPFIHTLALGMIEYTYKIQKKFTISVNPLTS